VPLVPRADSGWWLMGPLIIAGAGLGLLVSQLNNYTLSPISDERVSEAAGVNSAAGSFGLSFGLAFAGAIMLATLSFTSKGMLRDRVYGIKETLFHDPYYQRHVVGTPLVRSAEGGRFVCEANYAVFRTKLSDATTVFNVGRYLDTVLRTPGGLKFASRECIYDSEMIPNSIIYPI
jgi:hypothetical protein